MDWYARVVAPRARLRRLRGDAVAGGAAASRISSTAAAALRADSPIGCGGAGRRILNDVVLNQVLVRFGDAGDGDAATATRARAGGAHCWLGGTRWHGMDAMRISVSNWSTTDEDIDRSADAVLAAYRVKPEGDHEGHFACRLSSAHRSHRGRPPVPGRLSRRFKW